MSNEIKMTMVSIPQPFPFELRFGGDGEAIATLRFDKGEMTFTGNADAAAMDFLEHIVKKNSEQWKAAQKRIDELERECEELIGQRDASEEVISNLYESVTGHAPEWSNAFGYEHAEYEVAQECAKWRAAQEQNESVEVARAALNYIDAIPSEIAASFPVMPGFDRDWAENVLAAGVPARVLESIAPVDKKFVVDMSEIEQPNEN